MDVRHLGRGGLRRLPLFSAKYGGEAGSHRRAGRAAVSCSVVRSAGRRNRYAIQNERVVYYSLYMGRGGGLCHTAGGKEKEKKKQNGRKTQEQEGPSIDKSSKIRLERLFLKREPLFDGLPLAAQDVVPTGWRCVHIWMEAGAREAVFCLVSFVYIIQFT